jgi:regulatory protein
LHKGCAETLAAQVVARLRAEGLVSDERFVEVLIASRRRRGYGPLRILKELQEKGVEEETIARSLDVSGGEWLDEVRRVRVKKFGRRLPKSLTERARQARFLLYRGFTGDQIRRALSAREE